MPDRFYACQAQADFSLTWETKIAYQVPSFLRTGALNWMHFGYHYPSPPPIDLLSPGALEADNPWIVLAATIEHAKLGDHRHVRCLQRFFHEDPPLGHQCIAAIGAIGTDEDLRLLVPLMEEGSEDVRLRAGITAGLAGNL